MNAQVWIFRTIDEDTFIGRFGPKSNHLDFTAGMDFGDGGCLFSAAHKDFKYVLAQNPKTIWTVIEGDEGLAIESGLHIVNRLGYLVTTNPVEDRVTYTVSLDELTDSTLEVNGP